MRWSLAIAAALVGSAAVVPSASAECAVAEAFAAPADSESLPPNPTLWIFAPSHERADDSVEANVPMQPGAQQTFGDVSARAIRFAIRSGHLHVRVAERTYDYSVDTAWTRGEMGPRLGAAQDVVSAWTCSHDDHVSLPVESRAAAFEVAWPGGRTIVPAGVARYFDDDNATRSAILLGYVSCLGRTINAARRPDADSFEVTALYADGTRATVRGGHRVSPPAVPLTADGPTTPRSLPLAMSDWMPWLPLGLGLFSLLLIGGLAWRVRSRLRRMP